MADANSLLARFKAARTTLRMVDPSTGSPRDVPVDPTFAATVRADTIWLPIVSNIGTRIGQVLSLRDEDRVAVDDAIHGMIGECASSPIDDAVLRDVMEMIAERGLTLVPDTLR